MTLWHEERLLIDGELRDAAGGATYANISPTTGAAVGVAADGSAADIEAAIVAARRAFDDSPGERWTTDVAFRARCLRQLHDALRTHVEELTELTIAGNLKDMFRAITPADDLDFRYGVDAPTLRVDGMTIAGT